VIGQDASLLQKSKFNNHHSSIHPSSPGHRLGLDRHHLRGLQIFGGSIHQFKQFETLVSRWPMRQAFSLRCVF
jgi:hypothetical protein